MSEEKGVMVPHETTLVDEVALLERVSEISLQRGSLIFKLLYHWHNN